MHELSIAMSIIELAEEEIERRGVGVIAVHLRLGPLSGVVKKALEPAYEMACAGTALEGSRLVIEEMPVIGLCRNCQAKRTLVSMQLLVCPECGTPVSEVVQGRELEVFALEVDS